MVFGDQSISCGLQDNFCSLTYTTMMGSQQVGDLWHDIVFFSKVSNSSRLTGTDLHGRTDWRLASGSEPSGGDRLEGNLSDQLCRCIGIGIATTKLLTCSRLLTKADTMRESKVRNAHSIRR